MNKYLRLLRFDSSACVCKHEASGTGVLDVVTTLSDAEIYTKAQIASLYLQRWHAELDQRSIKVVLGMDVLRCKTPEMVRKEIGMTLAAYNVVRADGAGGQGARPDTTSIEL